MKSNIGRGEQRGGHAETRAKREVTPGHMGLFRRWYRSRIDGHGPRCSADAGRKAIPEHFLRIAI